ncbi:NAD(P)-dependent alcohol dehydrogenase [Egibacter rhizosphaerae]|uniref:NAD(P)-dependent alcohol dehydrogenase n=1 Tax=Egibacter rhizosphaerae TaxID=1670831 RepID=A0A411YGC2_9ACTN|nr:NAD(P)-dependent alcohol dehydrogenase [Egibacter rhizosphaerae]QBI20132.1 NAD(P)-dependent alcohol dehydrogenase [Egibacter rhizosphaerae]
MRAVVQLGYGGPPEVLGVRELDLPSLGDGEVLVRVRAASVHPDVWHVVTGVPRVLRLMGSGVRRPSNVVPGTDMAGEVESVGAGVTRLRPGDEVLGETLGGMQWRNGGAYAEYVAVAEDALAVKPSQVTFEQAATVPTAGLIALANLPDQDQARSQRMLVNGAGGGVGAIAVQLARSWGAQVTAVDHTRKLDLLRALGADRVIDYTTDDVTRSSDRYDLVFDVVGNHPFSAYRRVLADDGAYGLIGHDQFGAQGRRWLGSIPRMFGLMARSPVERRLPRPSFTAPDRTASMARLRDLLEDGAITPVVARAFPLEQVPDALELLASGQAVGRIVVVP